MLLVRRNRFRHTGRGSSENFCERVLACSALDRTLPGRTEHWLAPARPDVARGTFQIPGSPDRIAFAQTNRLHNPIAVAQEAPFPVAPAHPPKCPPPVAGG